MYTTPLDAGDLFVMDSGAYFNSETSLKLRESLQRAEAGRLRGEAGFTVAQASEKMKIAVQKTINAGKAIYA
jgi:hypothetical protein